MLRPKLLLIEIPGAVLAYIGFAALWNGAVPNVVPPSSASSENPLATPFVIENNGSFLAFEDVTTTCKLDQIEWTPTPNPANPKLSAMKLDHPQPGGRLSVGGKVRINCFAVYHMQNWTKLHLTGDMTAARAQITVGYRTFFIKREFISPHFCWSLSVPQWALCDSL